MTISGGSIQYATRGSGVGLECLVSGLRNPPLSLYWEKGNKVVTAKERPGVSLETEKLAGVSRIHLYIGQAVLEDTGNYTCGTDMEPALGLCSSLSPTVHEYTRKYSSYTGCFPRYA